MFPNCRSSPILTLVGKTGANWPPLLPLIYFPSSLGQRFFCNPGLLSSPGAFVVVVALGLDGDPTDDLQSAVRIEEDSFT